MNIEEKIKKIILKITKKKSKRFENIREIDYETLKNLIKTSNDITLVDVRSPQEYSEKKINTAINIPLYELDAYSNKLLPNKDSLIVLYCQAGLRSKKAYKILQDKGYTNLYSLEGGLDNI